MVPESDYRIQSDINTIGDICFIPIPIYLLDHNICLANISSATGGFHLTISQISFLFNTERIFYGIIPLVVINDNKYTFLLCKISK